MSFARFAGFCAVAAAVLTAVANSQQAQSADAPENASLADLHDFDGITLAGPDTVIVTRGASFTVRTEGDPRAVEKLRIYVRDGVLHVERKPHSDHGWRDADKGATVRVTLPVLRRASLAGSGDMRVDAMASEMVEATIAGSGDLSIARIEAGEAKLAVAGSGTLTAGGKVRTSAVSLAGSGDVMASGLAAETARVSVAGSGDAYIRASQAAKVSIVGSGDVMIKGTSNCEVSRVGSGDVHCQV